MRGLYPFALTEVGPAKILTEPLLILRRNYDKERDKLVKIEEKLKVEVNDPSDSPLTFHGRI